ncbi:unnamed protein product [Owenia fusiformis]|uniref:Uncharacterized protein n=1 Tax=Owenia fusiformis TaxID=6347 RepID=A0A8J1XTM4_OWEFU|nr:unnamed protein product [Owenia fusiformis]
MDSEKKALPSMIHLPEPEPIIIQKSQVPVKTSSDKTKKYLITAVIVVLMLLITLGAVFAIVKITHKYTEEAIKEYHITVRDNEKETNETVKVDKPNGMTEVDAPDLDLAVFNDFKKGLTVLKTHIEDVYGCYMTPISQDELTPEATESFLQHHPNGKVDLETPEDLTNVPKLMPADETVKDRNFLSQHVREACEGLPLYWLIPAPEEVVREGQGEESDDMVGGREDDDTSQEEQSDKTQEQSETTQRRMVKRKLKLETITIFADTDQKDRNTKMGLTSAPDIHNSLISTSKTLHM